MEVPGRRSLVIVVSALIGIALISGIVSAVVMPTTNFQISLERNGTPLNIFADFSMVCYGHSFLNVAGDNHFANVTPAYPVPLSRVLDLQVSCNPLDGCWAQSYNRGDPERSEWCELDGTTTGGDVIKANITQDNLTVSCSGGEYATDYQRCNAEARAKNPCDDLLGSKKLHCMDSRRDDESACITSYNESGYQPCSSVRWCEIRFNLPSSGAAVPDKVGWADTTVQPAAIETRPWSPIESLYCSLLHVFGGRC